MKKLMKISLLLALSLLLAGCGAKGSQVIIDVNGVTVDRDALIQEIDAQIDYNTQMNALYQSYYGVNPGFTTDREQVTQDVIDNRVKTLVALQKADEMGLGQMTADEEAEIEKGVQAQYDALIQSAISGNFADLPQDEAVKKAEEMAAENGITLERYRESAIKSLKITKLQAAVCEGVAIDENQAVSTQEMRIEEDKKTYTATPMSFGDYLNSGAGVPNYAPAGYRLVKHVLVQFGEEESAAINDKAKMLTLAAAAVGASEGDQKAAAQLEMDKATAALEEARAAARNSVQARVDEIYALATAENADFDALVNQYSDDAGMPARGYAMCEGHTSFSQAFLNAGMGLEKVGDVGQPVATDYGYHIMYYAADIPEGPYDRENALESIKAEMLEAAQEEVFFAQLEQWIDAAEVKTYPKRLK